MKTIIKKIQAKFELLFEKKPLAVAIWSLILTGICCLIIGALILIPKSGDFKGYFNSTNCDKSALGDTFNGLLGPIIAFLLAILTFLAFYIQYKANEIQNKSNKHLQFENKFYELIRLHRENVNDLQYTKTYKGKLEISESRKVFRVIFQEFIDCFHEVKRFTKIYPQLDILLPEYKIKLNKILKKNKCKASINKIAMIDIAYCFVYFGLSKENDSVFLNLFYNRYNPEFITRIKKFLRLKPKEEEEEANSYNLWEEFKKMKITDMNIIFEEIYKCRKKSDESKLSPQAKSLIYNLELDEYYGGHQHRLGHYFRHLFQSFKFLSSQINITDGERYFYGKTLRAQLSTYEQFLLFVNSLSSLGMKWEYTIEVDIVSEYKNKKVADFKFITRYNLIKNLPGSQYYDLIYREYYPDVNFEYRDDISYK